jgi:hypothetical protein
VVGDEQHPAGRGDVLDAERAGAEVMAVQPARDAERAAQRLARCAELVEPELVAAHDQRLGATCDVVLGHGAAEPLQAIEQAHDRQYARPRCDMIAA